MDGQRAVVQARRSLRRGGQATLEYFLLFAAVAALTIVGLTRFDEDVRATFEDLFQAAARKIAPMRTDGNNGGGGGGGGGGVVGDEGGGDEDGDGREPVLG